MAQDDGVRFSVLGTLDVRVGDDVIPLGSPKQRAILAMLVINRNRAVGAEELIDAAWEDSRHHGARRSLHTYVFNLRRLMAAAGIDATAALTKAAPGYRLSVPDGACDIGRFAAERTRGVHAAAGARFEEASRHFAAALAEWRGNVLDDLRGFTFFDAFATAMAEDRLVTQIAHAEAEIACGRPYSVISRLEELTADHPYREPLWAQLMTAYYLADRQTDALDAFHRLREMLVEELGVVPGRAVRTLHERILRHDELDPAGTAQSHADDTIVTLARHQAAENGSANGAVLRGADGRTYPLLTMSTRIGRSADNNVVLADGKVSRYHAAIIDTGSSFVIADLQSANGVYVLGRRIHASATLSDGDGIRIGDQRFTFAAAATEP